MGAVAGSGAVGAYRMRLLIVVFVGRRPRGDSRPAPGIHTGFYAGDDVQAVPLSVNAAGAGLVPV